MRHSSAQKGLQTRTTGRPQAAAVAVAYGIILLVSSIVWQQTPAFAATPVNLGTATPYSVLAATTVTNTGPTTLQGDLGLSPGTAITGFPPGIAAGTTHAADAVALQAQSDLTTAYNNAAGQPLTASVSGDLVGQTLTEGVYRSTTSLGLSGQLTLDGQGNPASVFIFQVASTLITASASSVILTNGAQACNVFWQVGSSATLGTASSFKGTILALTSVTVQTNARVEGRALARNGQVSLDTNVVTTPACVTTPTTSAPAQTTTPTPAVTSTETVTPTATTTATESAAATSTATQPATSSATITPTPPAPTTPMATQTAPVVMPTATATDDAGTPAPAAPLARTGTGGRNQGTNIDTAASVPLTGSAAPGAIVAALAAAGALVIAARLRANRRRGSEE